MLDRRKFCLARESKSGLGLTPLHTAAIYEQLDVFEYLAVRFPETLKLTDSHGLTPMDYVSSMPNTTFHDKLLSSELIFGVRIFNYIKCSIYNYYVCCMLFVIKTLDH